MFSQVSVCPQGSVCPIACWDTPPPRDERQTPLDRLPLGRHPPYAVHAGIRPYYFSWKTKVVDLYIQAGIETGTGPGK